MAGITTRSPRLKPSAGNYTRQRLCWTRSSLEVETQPISSKYPNIPADTHSVRHHASCSSKHSSLSRFLTSLLGQTFNEYPSPATRPPSPNEQICKMYTTSLLA